MTLAPYSPRLDAPTANLTNPGLRCTLAAEDRDLISEAANLHACVDVALEVNGALYPPLLFGTFTVPTIQN